MKLKNRPSFSVFMLISAFTILFSASCEKTKEEVIADITPSVSANINGTAWSTNIAAGVSGLTYIITATADSQAIILTVPEKAVGTYTVDGISTAASFVPSVDSASNAYFAYSGTIEISNLNFTNTQFNGTFNFKAINSQLDTISVTDGILKNIPTR